MNNTDIVLYSEQHALHLAKRHAMAHIVFGHVMDANPRNQFSRASVGQDVTKIHVDVDTGYEVENTFSISNSEPDDVIAKEIGEYLDRWADSHIVARNGLYVRKGRRATEILSDHGLDHEDVLLEAFTDPKMRAFAQAQTRYYSLGNK